MRQLLLLRHAKSSWDDPALADFERPLALRGRQAAPLIGREMARRGWLPDLALVSAAVRSQQTWELVCGQWSAGTPAAAFTEAIYEAAPRDILGEIRQVSADVRCLLVVGHNPGLELLARDLAGPGTNPAVLARLKAKFPPAALARFEIATGWPELCAGSARLMDFIRPRDLG